MTKKVLVISNAGFSLTDANGSTLAKLFNSVSKEHIAQFFVYGNPDNSLCDSYYQLTDKCVLRSFFKGKSTCSFKNTGLQSNSKSTPVKKSPAKCLLREFAWKFGRWYNDNFKSWINEVNPVCIFLFLADNAFLPELAFRISKEKNIPIIAYTTEDYYFKKYNYINQKNSLFYNVLHNKLVRAYKKCEPRISTCFLNTPVLKKMFDYEFGFPCECLWPQSDVDFIDRTYLNKNQIVVSYLGNLGLNRHKALKEIAFCLNSLCPGTKLHVYGNLPLECKDDLLSDSNIEYMGFVDRQSVVSVIHNSDLLIHAEYNNDYNNIDLQCAFSTKIADSVSSGTPLLLYASDKLAETQILAEYNSAFIAKTSEELKGVLSDALFNTNKRKEILSNAKKMRDTCFTDSSVFTEFLHQYIF